LPSITFQTFPCTSVEVVTGKVIKFFCQFKNASEDIHLSAPNDTCVAGSRAGYKLVVLELDLAPLPGDAVEGPQVTDLDVFIFLATEGVDFI